MNLKVGLLFAGFIAWLLSYACCQLQCNGIGRLKHLTLRKPAQFTQNTCRYKIQPANGFVCQVRIDFNIFELPQPAFNASTEQTECTDYLQVQRFKLCGHNTGQHLYIPMGRSSDVDFGVGNNLLILDFMLHTHWPETAWQLSVTQLDCPQNFNRFGFPRFSGIHRTIFTTMGMMGNSLLPNLWHNATDYEQLAPMGCDQYHVQQQGTIRSFNFISAEQDGLYMPSTEYSICVRPMPNTEIDYTFTKFTMATNSEPGLDENCHAAVHTNGRNEDYLLIPKSRNANNAAYQSTYYCGTSLNALTIRAQAPFIIYFVSDNQMTAAETGFELSYKMQPRMTYA